MVELDKVIKGLEHCKIGKCVECPYDQIKEESLHGKHDKWELVCNEQLTEDILSLLKEQEAVKPVRDEQTGRVWLCGNCGSYVGFEDNDPYDPNEFDKYCRECGRPVLWTGGKL